MDKCELRLDPLTERWTIFSEARAVVPLANPSAQFEHEQEAPDPFRAGLEHYAPHELYRVPMDGPWQVRVVPNRLPALRIEGDATPRSAGFYDRMDGVGAHEVIIEDPGDRTLEELPLPDIERVVDAWQTRILDLLKDHRLRTFFIVKNVGKAAGGYSSHSLSQLIAMAIVPQILRHKLQIARAFYAAKERSIFEDILAEEVRVGTRLVYENNGFTAFCPYASRAPFEMSIFPKRQAPDFHTLSSEERAQLADVLRATLRKLGIVLGRPAYNLMLFTAPRREAHSGHEDTVDEDFRWHIEIVPRLHHLGGIEHATGCWVNSVWPEFAADLLRGAPIDS